MQCGPGNRISHLVVISRTLLIVLLTLFSAVGYSTEEVQQVAGTEAVQPSQEVANHPGGMIDVMFPLVGDADNRTKRKIRELLDRIGPTPERPIVVLRLSVGYEIWIG